MMAQFKYTPLELDGQLPKELAKIVEDKWHFCLMMENEMRESTLASVLPDLTKEQISNAVKRHNKRFTPKYRAFFILQNKIEEIVQRTTRSWRKLYKQVEDVFEEEYNKLASTKPEERRKRKEEKTEAEKKVEEEENRDRNTEMQQDQSVQDTQLPPPSPPQSIATPAEVVKIKDVDDTSNRDISPLTAEDLTKILDQSTHQAQLCTKPIVVSVEELQKSVEKIKKGEVKPQEPPQVTCTTGLSLSSPPSPLKLPMEAHQEPSATAWEDTSVTI